MPQSFDCVFKSLESIHLRISKLEKLSPEMLEGGKRQEGREGWGRTEWEGGKGLVKESSSRGTALALCPSPVGWEGGRRGKDEKGGLISHIQCISYNQGKAFLLGLLPGMALLPSPV